MKILFILALTFFQFNAYANFEDNLNLSEENFLEEENLMDELDPRSPDIEEKLREFDEDYYRSTGKSPFLERDFSEKGSCYRNSCPIWARVSKDEQLFYLYVDGAVKYVWLASTGRKGYSTPYMDQNPNGRIYDRYTSVTNPGGDYNGLGNMPYAVFIRGGYAVHGTTRGNWPSLGKPASKGCIRLHPDNGFIFNRLVRSYGIYRTWITVE